MGTESEHDVNPDEATGNPEPSSDNTPTQPPKNWEKAYKGLQSQYAKLQSKYDALKTESDGVYSEVEGYKQELRTKDARIAELEAIVAAKDGEQAELASAKSKAEQQLSRMKLIGKEFRDLLELEAEGMLPTAENEEELRQKLSAYRDKLKAMVGKNVGDLLSGGTPPPPEEDNASTTADELYEQMIRMAGRDEEKFRSLQKQYDELLAKQTKN